jgi:hypothetical protein
MDVRLHLTVITHLRFSGKNAFPTDFPRKITEAVLLQPQRFGLLLIPLGVWAGVSALLCSKSISTARSKLRVLSKLQKF